MATITELPKISLTFAQKLDRLAQVAVSAGLGLERGQELVMTASLDALPLARLITEHAYKAGASLVTTLYTDEPSTLLRYRNGEDAGFDKAAGWLYEGMAAAFRSGAARLAIAGGDPSLLSKEDPDKVGRANRAVSKAYRPAIELITRHEINWTIVACATPAWAAAVFPDLPPEQAMSRLWDAIFAASRVDLDDPIARWKQHDAGLHRRADLLNQKRYAALHFRGPRDRPACGIGGRSSLDGRRDKGRHRRLLHCQYADRRGIHDPPQRSRGGHRDQHQAALSPGNADRENRGAFRGRPRG